MSVSILLYRNTKQRFYNKFTVVMTALQPVLRLIPYSVIASPTMQYSGIENYTAFMFPGLVVLINFSTCDSSGVTNYLMKSDGSSDRILIAPLARSSIVLAQLFEAVSCIFLEIGIMVALSLLFSIRFSPPLSGYLIFTSLIFLTSFFMVGLSYGVNMSLSNEVIYEAIMNAIVLPVSFLSSALFPMTSITDFLHAVISLNPFTHATQALRSLILHDRIGIGNLATVLLLFIFMGSLSFLRTHRQLEKKTNLQLKIV